MELLPLVSIITPCYNSAKYIGDTIESIQSQSYKNWELLITDDCSTDDTTNIANTYARSDNRIKLFKLTINSGGGIARNNSIKEAKGRYIAFCDSDDRWAFDKLEKQIAFMQKRQCAFSYSSYMTCDEEGEAKGIVVCPSKVTFSSAKKDNKIGCLTIVYDTSLIGKIYLPNIRKRQDWGLSMRILQKCNIAYGLKEPLAFYRLRKDSLSSNKLNLIKYNIGVYEETLGWSKIYSIFYFTFMFIPSYIAKTILIKLYNK